jgi:hypothetical protein
VLALMHKVTLIPAVRRTLFGPRITVFTKDGKSYTREGSGREFVFDFDTLAARLLPVAPGLPIPAQRFGELIDTCRGLERSDQAARRLIGLTLSA